MAITAMRRMFCGGRRRRGKSHDGFARDDEGSAAVEFALTAPLFFAALLSIFEFAMLFGTSVLLEAATNKAARAVRTGQVYVVTTDPEIDPDTGEITCNNQQVCAFEKAMCSGLIFIDCSDLSYDVQVYTNFSTANANIYCNSSGTIDSPAFDIGEPAQVVVLTVLYPYKPILPNPLSYAGQDWKSAGGCNGLSMKSVLVFVNEPFPKV